MDTHRETRVAVIGAGIVGLMTALEIQRSGRRVIVIDAGEPGGRQAASYGNGAWISAFAIMPMSVPGLWRQVLGFLTDKSGPFVIRWRYLPRLLPWLLRFVWAGRTWQKVEACVKVRFELCRRSPQDHRDVAAEAGVSHLIERKGHILVYPDKSHFLADGFAWRMRQRLGLQFTELDDTALHQLEANVSERYQYGVWIDGCHCTDVKAYCAAIAALIQSRGGEFIRAQATGLVISEGRLQAVQVGETAVECSQAVVTAGIGSKALAAAAGDRVPLESERGYHVVIADGRRTTHPILPSDGRMALTPTLRGLRVAGQVELASVKAAPDWRRAEILRGWICRVFQASFENAAAVDKWMGHRPSTPDGLPCIGAAPTCAGLFYGFGHGHTGLTQAPATGKLLAALIAGREPPFDISPMSVQRF